MSSRGALSTATDSRGATSDSREQGYRIILPQLPMGVNVLNSVFLHCDISGRPYRIEDFRNSLETVGVLKEVAACGSYQMNHVWMVTLHSLAAKHKLASAKELLVKGKRCLVIDPDKTEVRLRLHWVPYHVTDDNVKTALEPYGRVEEVTREKWHVKGFEGVQSTTRLARLTLKEGKTIESLPHQIRLAGGMVLVVAPGRPPLCLRCRRTGHIRKECRVPRCDSCRRFGHTQEDCTKTYAAAVNATINDEDMELTMDQYEAEEAARETPGTGEGEPLPAAPQQPRETPSQLNVCSLTSIGQPKVKAPSEPKSPRASTSGLQDTSDGNGNDEAMECLDGPLKRSLPAAHGEEGEPTRLEATDGTAKRTEPPKRLRSASKNQIGSTVRQRRDSR
ncbi:uncharacterized protein ISCGN_010327 [Ixodes scapularis]